VFCIKHGIRHSSELVGKKIGLWCLGFHWFCFNPNTISTAIHVPYFWISKFIWNKINGIPNTASQFVFQRARRNVWCHAFYKTLQMKFWKIPSKMPKTIFSEVPKSDKTLKPNIQQTTLKIDKALKTLRLSIRHWIETITVFFFLCVISYYKDWEQKN